MNVIYIYTHTTLCYGLSEIVVKNMKHKIQLIHCNCIIVTIHITTCTLHPHHDISGWVVKCMLVFISKRSGSFVCMILQRLLAGGTG